MQPQKSTAKNSDGTINETYSKITIGKTTYCLTSVFTGEINAIETLERLAVTKALGEIEEQRKKAQSKNHN